MTNPRKPVVERPAPPVEVVWRKPADGRRRLAALALIVIAVLAIDWLWPAAWAWLPDWLHW